MLNRNGLFGKHDAKPEERTHKDPEYGTQASPRTLQPVQATPPSDRPDRAPATAPAAPASRVMEETPGSKLIVGPNIRLKGVEITNCDTLVVEGHVEATMDSRLIQIADSGTFSGTVGIDVAEIRGKFSGELTARKRLVIHSTGKVSGKIRYGKIVIEEGGELTGEVTSLAPISAEQGHKTADKTPGG